MTNYWLMKSEPNCFSIDDLIKEPNSTTHWDGIRNYQARNFIRDDMQVHDKVFFYHSSCKQPGIVGIAEIVSQAYPDHTAWDPNSEHPDSKSTPDKPIWYMVDVKFEKKMGNILTLDELRTYPELANFRLLQRGNRLSIFPVGEHDWNFINKLIA